MSKEIERKFIVTFPILRGRLLKQFIEEVTYEETDVSNP